MSPFEALQLPNGQVIANRIAKAAMEENMADTDQAPSRELKQLYTAWADGLPGLLLTGNVMIDRRAMTGPGGVVLEDEQHLDRFREWADVARNKDVHFWVQLSHPGRQTPANLRQQALAPSAVALDLGGFSRMFAKPKAMTEADIEEVIQRFAISARLVEKAGFTGVQIHGAHGYLLSQFLSPLSNQRTDRWGGPLENRARLLLEVVQAVRDSVSPAFCVAVKLNSADFQCGGFDETDARAVVEMLNTLPIDLLELSGGSYEAPAMQGEARDGRTLAREAYFLEFASEIAAIATMPVMVTGGIRRLPVVQQVLDSGIAMAGIATALTLEPQLIQHWRQGRDPNPQLKPTSWKRKPLAALATLAVVRDQMRRLSRERLPNPKAAPWLALACDQWFLARRTRQYRASVKL
ncbi:2,4-dienoyl-CoA reductase (NADPH) [Pseudomonas synxantha]|uniref:Oxidoreductase, FAD/FMN dependent n=1 Tax=Pseudomonas synxantha TaxID=47883 RepID=A0AAX3I9C9_9PSED|nr:NADH:flavin oxidoreductase/NADH oxidase family protein [Pseudomonas synxantha]AZE66838.1 2,4-dienoyl-CoA reductase (NADPH) [Pseudomonas synxantha]AZE72683.1 2,4-dienoyl-CoA reductase (NADPH) [Pseudomonas synxantha]AZE78353.1 2,4-dienoyl-CoA reductase (NADPH) [Pseudomonas synxantha]KRP56227.1 2,4-dienoyl-CoA reductase [Pseudomonas synxantha]MDQ0980876.1 2,4-dienoyl-CoA reductase-like NADH-dependent reductase (Old Yellow Enzyme family) [Pseudomonas synxantha]